ncbi:MAG: amino acid adenylation domain-containing protein, partial [bacterium]|nr:amino acid adenylation domain-containing protein [bacterium]
MLAKKFEEQVKKSPGNIAVKTNDETYTYSQLNNYADGISRQISLRHAGGIVGLLLPHGAHMIAAILGALKAGKTYVPLSVDYPANRIAYMLSHSGASLVVTTPDFEATAKEAAGENGGQVLVFTPGKSLPAEDTDTLPKADAPKRDTSGGRIAYILYTSGSTGNPKGVVQTHENADYYNRNWIRIFSIGPRDRMTLFSSFCHDGSVQDMYSALHSGATLYPIDMKNRESAVELSDFLLQEKITIWHSVPSLFSYFANTLEDREFPLLRFILLGGEAVRLHEVKLFKKYFPNSTLANVYGQTESSVNSICLIGANERYQKPLIGEPLDETEIFVVDEDGCPVDPLESGIILVACKHISPGYWKNPEVTETVFLEDDDIGRMYWTGDLGSPLPDGNIEFLGRADHQVKIRGFRVELGEIESQLLKHHHVNEAVVIARDDKGGDKYLTAYMVVTDPENGADTTELRNFLKKEIPDYMVPAFFVTLDKMPLTATGKIDRKALPEPRVMEPGQDFCAPRDETEETLTSIWSEVLGVEKEKIGIDSDFFQLGGHSLRATVVLSNIHKQLDINIPLTAMFKTPTIRQLAGQIKKTTGKEESGYRFTSIPHSEKMEYYPLSSSQKRFYLLQQMEPSGTAYNITNALKLVGNLDGEALERAVNRLVERHESLRTSFHLINEQSVQKIHPFVSSKGAGDMSIVIEYHETPETQQAIETKVAEFIKPFDLSEAPLIRLKIITLSAGRYILFLDMHHIISDATSMGVFSRELIELLAGKELADLSIQYKDFARWQESLLSGKGFEKEKTYWLETFSTPLPVLSMPLDFLRPAIQQFDGDDFEFEIPGPQYEGLRRFTLETGLTIYMVLLSALNIVLSRYSGQEDIIIGTPSAGRTHADLGGIVGLLIDTLAMRNRPAGNKKLKMFLEEVKAGTLTTFENQSYPSMELIQSVADTRDISRNPLFDVILNLLNTEQSTLEIEGLSFSPFKFEKKASMVDFALDATEGSNVMYFKLEYCTALFKRDTMERFRDHFLNILMSMTALPGSLSLTLSELEMLSEEERRQIMEDFNGVSIPCPGTMVDELFKDQVSRTPARSALIGPWHGEYLNSPDTDTTTRGGTAVPATCYLTYRQLDEDSDRLAFGLQEKGIGVGDIIGILVSPSVEMMIGLLGILKSGAAYLPIDPEYPHERIDYMLKDSSAAMLLTTQVTAGTSGLSDTKAIAFDKEIFTIESATHKYPQPEPAHPQSPTPHPSQTKPLASQFVPALHIKSFGEFGGPFSKGHSRHTWCGLAAGGTSRRGETELAYIIYTSGSTGRPKGVAVEHRNLSAYIVSFEQEFDITGGDTVIQQASYSFDAFVEEVYPVLTRGGRLACAGKDEIRDIELLTRFLVKHKVTVIDCSPLLLNQLNGLGARLPRMLRIFISGGDVLKKEYVDTLVEQGHVYNTYGPTETTVCATYYKCSGKEEDFVPIGRAIANYTVSILDAGGRMPPIGVPGEICVSGVGVARGYLNNPGLTAAQFIAPDTGLNTDGTSAGTIYKTGDRGMWLPDGGIRFLGRIDQQVKIRGYRIEPGEIEKQLLNHQSVKEVVVTARETTDGDKYLCAHLVPAAETTITIADLREHLLQTLPPHMVPAHFVQIEAIPFTFSGKVDAAALPDPDESIATGTVFITPSGPVQTTLAQLWAEVLNVTGDIGIDDDFFAMGGHSLKATTLLAKTHKALDVKIPLMELFKTPTIRGLHAYVENAASHTHISIEPVEEREYYPLSSAQKRLYFLDTFDEAGTAYNISMVYIFKDRMDNQRYENAFKALTARHDSLRTSFGDIRGEPAQVIHKDAAVNIDLYQRSDGQEVTDIIRTFIRPFDLSKAPLLRIGTVALSEEEYVMMFDMHHIVSDGASMELLAEDFIRLYEGETLPPLRLQYKDFALWQKGLQESGSLAKQKSYWLELYRDGDEIPVLELVADFPRPPVYTFAGDRCDFRPDSRTVSGIRALTARFGGTLFITLTAALNILLHKYTGQEDIIVGSGIMDRPHADLYPIVGMFINALALRNRPQPGKTCSDFLKEVKQHSLHAFANQDVQFEDLVDSLDLARNPSRNPLFDVSIVVQNYRTSGAKMKSATVTPFPIENKTAKFDLTLYVYENEETIAFSMEYNTALFKAETIQRMLVHFQAVLQEMSGNPYIVISDMDILPEDEKQRLLVDFNDTAADYPREKTIHQLFERQVEKTPDNIALVGESCKRVATAGFGTGDASVDGRDSKNGPGDGLKRFTYKDLDEQADGLARVLISRGMKPAGIAAVMVERSVELIIGIFGILKAGGAYLPIAADCPPERVRYMLEDSSAGLLLTNLPGDGREPPAYFEKEILYAEDILSVPPASLPARPGPEEPETSPSARRSAASEIAYAIYTSGSTGRPKGVAVEHRGIANIKSVFSDRFEIGHRDNVLQFAAISFDASVWEIFMALLNGAGLHVPSSDIINDSMLFLDYLETHKITITLLPPPYAATLDVGRLKGLRILLTGGSAPNPDFIRKCEGLFRYINAYGPTEDTICSTYLEIENYAAVNGASIGKPMGNKQIYILDKQMNPQPIGVPGELCVSGAGVARGYLNRPELTARQFVPAAKACETFDIPSSAATSEQRLYKTGDLARWLPDGNIEFLGRIDFQVKIRGFRIEPGEIEAQLTAHEAIKEAVVAVRGEGGEKSLWAYYVPRDPEEKQLTLHLGEALSEQLPSYMIPAGFIQMESLPLTSSGKVDTGALPAPTRAGTKTDDSGYVPPADEVEEILAGILADVLGLDRVSVFDNFFTSGGDSIKAMQVTGRLQKHRLKMTMKDFFRHPTIRGLRPHITTVQRQINQEPVSGNVPLTP